MVNIKPTTSTNPDSSNQSSSNPSTNGSSTLGQNFSTLSAQLDSMRAQPVSVQNIVDQNKTQVTTLNSQNADELSAAQQSGNEASNFTNQNFDLAAEAQILLGKAKELEFRAEGKPLSEALALKQEAKRMRDEAKEKLQEAEQASVNADAATVEATQNSSAQNDTQNKLDETTSAVSTNSNLVTQLGQVAQELLKNLGLS